MAVFGRLLKRSSDPCWRAFEDVVLKIQRIAMFGDVSGPFLL